MSQIDVRTNGDGAVLALKGELTLEHTGLLPEKVRALLDEGHRKILLDLTSLSYADTAGIGEVVHIYVTVQREGAVLRLRQNDRLADLLRITKLLTLFEGDPQEHIPDQPDPLNPRLRDIRWEFTVGAGLTILAIIGVMFLLR
jgi:anti-anti-sigma factor